MANQTDRREERRGDRRRAQEWECPSNVDRVRAADPDLSELVQGRCRGARHELPDGRVTCGLCGTVDHRSTEENRREARDELAVLERRIRADMERFPDYDAGRGPYVHALCEERRIDDARGPR